MKSALRAILTLLLGGVVARAGGFDRAIEVLMPRVVKIYGLGVGREAGYGTGILVSAEGHVLTVFSLLIDARRLRIVTSDGTRYEAEVLHRDPGRQLALLKLKAETKTGVDGSEGAKSFEFFDLTPSGGTTDKPPLLRPGDWIVAAGNPFKIAEGAEPASIAHGVFSIRTRLDARRGTRDFPYRGEILVIDAVTSNPGAPGSAVVNLDGEFVGMIGRVVTSNLTHTHFNYAIPREVLEQYFQEAMAPPGNGPAGTASGFPRQDKSPPDLGIRLVRAGYQKTPPIVERVRKGSPAELIGIRKDDIILSFNGHSLADVRDYDERLANLTADDSVDLVIRRDRQILRFQLKPEKKP